jgi:phage tail sheath gpL-like
MPISFANIPQNIKVPLYWVEVDPSMAGLPSINLRALLFGTMLGPVNTVGSAVPATPGSGYLVNDTINLDNGVELKVLTVTTGGVATVSIIDSGAAVVVPTGPQPQIGTSGSGINATFTLTWINNPLGGTAVPDVPIPIGSQAQADQAFGQGSELARMFKAFYASNFANEVWGVGVKEPAGASAATGTITITAPPTSAGTIHLYVGGEYIPVNIQTTDTNDDIASAIADEINNMDGLAVSAVAAAGVVTMTANWKGVGGNEIMVSMNYYGGLGGEQTPVGLGILLPATQFLTGGVGTPVITNAIVNMGEEPFEYVCSAWTDSNTLFEMDQELGFTDSGRWGWQRQLFGHCFAAKRGTYSDLLLFGETMNSGVISIMSFEKLSPSPSFEWAASYTAKAQRALINDPARPLQALSLNQIKLAPKHERFDFIELNSLASTGMAIQKAGSDNQPMIAREQTTYQLNLYGQSDDAYELVTTLATLAKLLRNQRQAITSKFPRHKLASDGTKFSPGQAIVTPGIIKSELVAEYRMDEYNGLAENTQQFKAHLIVERDQNNPNRVNVLYPPDLINQLRVFAVLAQFRLQYDRGIDLEIVGGLPPSPFNAASGL